MCRPPTMPTQRPLSSSPKSLYPINGALSPESVIAPPRTPSPAPIDSQPLPLRQPETLGTLIEVRNASGKGLGVFALCDIPSDTVLLSEAPLVTLIDTGTRADPLDATIASLPLAQRNSFLSLSHYSRNVNESTNRSIVYSNGYSINKDMATGVFETASRINHSCVPNSAYVWKEDVGRMVFWNRVEVLRGEEVTVNYGHNRGQLKRIYGFECQCEGCLVARDEGRKAEEGIGTIVEKVGAIKLELPEAQADSDYSVEGSDLDHDE